MEKLLISRPVIVEGRYDKIKLDSILDANIIITDGFGLFRAREKSGLIRRIAKENGVIVLTDSDNAGLFIRNYINSILPKEQIINLYIPEKSGRERRKNLNSKANLLGVEGIDADLLRSLFLPYSNNLENVLNPAKRDEITKLDFYADGLSGGTESSKKRKNLALACGLPSNLSANALLAALNMLYSRDEYKRILLELD